MVFHFHFISPFTPERHKITLRQVVSYCSFQSIPRGHGCLEMIEVCAPAAFLIKGLYSYFCERLSPAHCRARIIPTLSLIGGVRLEWRRMTERGAAADNAVALERREAQGSPRTRARAPQDIRASQARPGSSAFGWADRKARQGSLASSPAPPGGEKENRDTSKSWPPELKPPGSGALA